ncbi:cytochrome o ubiquinol oxidase subunit III [Bordetella genomosp. 5]|uniref:Cytochrome bo(3) ubiquinol oxidase subunit 3 n=1 Tax=Bordetella genomosp. 5 TaxID=1395608 RepID=A0A261T8K6_9BORD|nr:cytochrome o ubiquinol oxidase subunit III [Bordetella genomosp. 5]OZI45765.1 cytochrome o ubiquinol oxidase subunit III [Bordetella genomosp. 5]OZI46111.1 cytochrome o ubiquinol oxidase subunit III [Bordetella genomosp. 5]
MTNAVATHSHGAHDHGHEHHDDGSKTVFGFWVYLMSDLLIFSVLFATFAVLSNATAGGPHGRDLFDLSFVLVETMLLLVSSFTFGVAMLNLYAGNRGKVIAWLWITFLFGAGFIAMEIYEFMHLIHLDAGPGRSAYLSAFFTLIGTHGLHVTAGLIWILVMIDMVRRYGLDSINKRRLACLSLFWHFLDIVWICVFTFVYLMGAL